MSQQPNKRPLITDVNPKSPISEAFRVLRTNIDFSGVDGDIRVIMLTSAGPGEGKSTTAANIGVVYAQSDKRVLIIDADLRKPTMHHSFNKTNRTGLTSHLAGHTPITEAIKETHIPNLHLLTSGPIPPNPSEILASKKMLALLAELKEMYDIIIVDTPPALAVTDSQIVAALCDGVLLVIDSGKVKRELAMKAKSNMEHVKARILGVVLNNVNKNGEDYYYYYYYGNRD